MKSKKFVFPLVTVLGLGLAASFNGCSCGAEAKIAARVAQTQEEKRQFLSQVSGTAPIPAPEVESGLDALMEEE